MIKCPICNNEYVCISKSHLKVHNLTSSEFIQKYPKSKDDLQKTFDEEKYQTIRAGRLRYWREGI